MALFGLLKKKKAPKKSSYKLSRSVGLTTAVSHHGWYQCVHCGKNFRKGDIQIDHIIPRSKGGTDSAENLQCLCKLCNQKKSNNMQQTKVDLKRRAKQLSQMKKDSAKKEKQAKKAAKSKRD